MKRKEKERGEVRKIMRMKKTKTAMDRKEKQQGGRHCGNKAGIDNIQ